jgi:hypothetical protein
VPAPTDNLFGSIAKAASSPVGSAVRVIGIVVAVRRLGKLTFLLIRDSFSDIQCVAGADAQELLKNECAPFYASVSGTLRRRPAADARPDAVNGTLEIAVDALRIYRGTQPAIDDSPDALRFTTFLQSRGFADVQTLARLFAPAYLDLIAADGLGAAKHLAYLLGPCRWYVLAADSVSFGVTPGFVADLKDSLSVEGHDTGTLREMLDGAHWHQESADAADVPSAVGTVAISGRKTSVVASDAYWRRRHSVQHLNDEVVSGALRRTELDDVAVQTLEERLARSEAVAQSLSGSAANGAVMALRDFPEFDLHARHIERMLALFPSLQRRLAHCNAEQQFELLWSLLGHDHVKAIFTSADDVDRLSACVQAGLFADYNVLRHLDGAALQSICVLTSELRRADAVGVIDDLFNSAPSVSASACHLMERMERYGLDWRRCAAVAKHGVISALAFAAAARGDALVDELGRWRRALASSLSRVFTNDPVDEAVGRTVLAALRERFPWLESAADQCRDADLNFDVVHLTFGPGLVAYEEAARMFSAAPDCSHHWALAGIEFGGERWNERERRFELTDLHLYPSKNRAAILAKSCSGICSARDVRLFNRPDHFQFTIVDSAGPAAAGTVQLYRHRDDREREIWVVRALNPSEKVTVSPAGFTIEVLDALSSLARHNGVGALVYADGAGLFNADSARVNIRTVIRRLSAAAKKISFDTPLHLFDYHNRPIEVDFGWQVWP